MSFLLGKRFLITGMANTFSIAYGIAKAMHKQGAKLAFSYQNDRFKTRVEDIAKKFNSNIVLPCDVMQDENIKSLFFNLQKNWEKFDGFVHSIAFAPTDQFDGNYLNCINRKSFKLAHEISSYSFVAMAKESRYILNSGSALLTISYLGSERVVPNYNVMGSAKASLEANVRYIASAMGSLGIRVNAISAGPVRTLASSAIKNFRKILIHSENITPISRMITIDEIGNSAAFLCSDLASAITGEVLHVDGGFNITVGNEFR